MKNIILVLVLITTLMACNVSQNETESHTLDPLPSWNEGPAKKTIENFVTEAISTGSGHIPVTQRIAVFDNDGTLWSEQPLYFQFFFTIDRIKAMAPSHPEWKDTQPFKAVLENDMETLEKSGVEGLLKLTMATHGGMTTTEFDAVVKEWINTAKHPKSGKLYKEMVYQPMLELLQYLRDNDFKTFIVSGGGIDFMRVFAHEVYGIPPYQVVGSRGKIGFEMVNNEPTLVKLPEIDFIDDKGGKPIGIHQHIGLKPVLAAGNSDGDLQMLQWTATQKLPSLMIYIHHTDEIREWAYDRNSHIGQLDKGLDEAMKKAWTVVDMKKDWGKIYPYSE